jgi:hypothetical protein
MEVARRLAVSTVVGDDATAVAADAPDGLAGAARALRPGRRITR